MEHSGDLITQHKRFPVTDYHNIGTLGPMSRIAGDHRPFATPLATRGCRFCAVESAAKGEPLDSLEPKKLAYAVKEFGLGYVVITSVDRDDLQDQGAGHFADCIKTLHEFAPNVLVEVLTPDFRGNFDCIKTVIDARPTVFAHNIETVTRLKWAIPPPRKASSKEASISLCLPTPFVRNISFGMYIISIYIEFLESMQAKNMFPRRFFKGTVIL